MIICIVDFCWIRVGLPWLELISVTIPLCTLSATHIWILSTLVWSLLWIEDLIILFFLLDSLRLFALVFFNFGVCDVTHTPMPSPVALGTDRLAFVTAAINTPANDLEHLIIGDHRRVPILKIWKWLHRRCEFEKLFWSHSFDAPLLNLHQFVL